jgi:hypothetical protein
VTSARLPLRRRWPFVEPETEPLPLALEEVEEENSPFNALPKPVTPLALDADLKLVIEGALGMVPFR